MPTTAAAPPPSVSVPARGMSPVAGDAADDDPLVLPDPPDPPRRSNVPLIASIVPVAGAIGLWLLTGSAATLWFAALGPLIAAATVADGRRTARRERRHRSDELAAARVRVADEIDRRHARERERLDAVHPDAAGLAQGGSDGVDGVWRTTPGRAGVLVAGRGDVASAVRVRGGGAEAAELRRRARTLSDAPVAVAAADGIAVVGPTVAATAVVRALVLQAVLAAPPTRLRITGSIAGEHAWSAALPHRLSGADVSLAVCGPGDAVPAAGGVIARVRPGDPVPAHCAAVLTLTGPVEGSLVVAGVACALRVEAVGLEQATAIAEMLATRADAAGRSGPPPVAPLADLLSSAPGSHGDGLAAVLGVADGRAVVVDLVADGPHAVVTGVTGSGKSELLTSWITALCATYSTGQVVFLLADFKGGTAFDALAGLRHVTGVITDLDDVGARRALDSLRAELRHREARLVEAGVRDIGEGVPGLPRLVVVVDEFAALAAAHPDLPDLFADIAARGRALGVHLILGTQRAPGVVRDALLANCPLRISLRVTDPSDSRAVIGIPDAAHLPGGSGARGMAFVRGASDPAPRSFRVALASAELIAATHAGAEGPSPRRPWLPDLPAELRLAGLVELGGRAARRRAGRGIVLGLADDPGRQRQFTVTLDDADRGLVVLGGPGSGRSTLVRTVAAQVGRPRRIGPDPEAAWDDLARIEADPPAADDVVLVDDVDTLVGRFPPDYAAVVIERLQRLVRGGGGAGPRVVLTALRASGAIARLVELSPRRVILGMPSRADHVAAGGDAALFRDGVPPGRGCLDGRIVQIARPDDAGQTDAAPAAATDWRPAGVTGLVLRAGPGIRRTTAALEREGVRVIPLAVAAESDRWREPTGGPVVVIGDADSWQRHWRVLSVLRAEHELVVDADCAAEYRMIAGHRDLPPYCEPGRGGAWLLGVDGDLTRIALPGRGRR